MTHRTKTIAIIPARGGSKRIPHKNIVNFAGKPMLAWTIEAAQKSKKFDRILVSTDDLKIKSVALSLGAECPFMREMGADDHAPASVATLHALSQAEQYWSEDYAVVAQLMPNCPLRNEHDIHIATEQFERSGAAFQISALQFNWANPWWAATIDDQGRPKALFPEQQKLRSQDLPPLYCPTGAIWIAKTEALKAAGSFYGPDHRFCVLGDLAAVDIDTPEDLVFAARLAIVKN